MSVCDLIASVLTLCNTCKFLQSEGWPGWLAGLLPKQCSHSGSDGTARMTGTLQKEEEDAL